MLIASRMAIDKTASEREKEEGNDYNNKRKKQWHKSLVVVGLCVTTADEMRKHDATLVDYTLKI